MKIELEKTGKEITYVIADVVPFLFPKRHRRVRWADTLPDDKVTKLSNSEVRPEDMQTDVKFSALGWGCAQYIGNTRKIRFVDDKITIDGIDYTEFMPEQVRDWFGISELSALKIQALQLNNAETKKIAKLIKEI